MHLSFFLLCTDCELLWSFLINSFRSRFYLFFLFIRNHHCIKVPPLSSTLPWERKTVYFSVPCCEPLSKCASEIIRMIQNRSIAMKQHRKYVFMIVWYGSKILWYVPFPVLTIGLFSCLSCLCIFTKGVLYQGYHRRFLIWKYL